MSASPATESLREAAHLHRVGALEAAEERYRSAAATLTTRSSERYLALLGLTRVQVDLGRFEGAATSCREAIACAPGRSGPYGVLALTLVSAGKLEAAAEAVAAARKLAPEDRSLLHLSASIALRRSRPAEARAFSLRTLAHDPHDQRALADLAFARGPLDTERLLRVTSVVTPDGFESLDAFNRGLAAAITGSPVLEEADRGVTLSGGRRLPDLFALDPCWSRPLCVAFHAALEDYLTSVRIDVSHPVVTGRPARFEFRGWANVLREGDFEHPHIHESGWLSGVYYVELPEESDARKGDSAPRLDGAGALKSAGALDRAGALIVGGHPCEAPGREPLLRIEPRRGRMVLFPSYFYHRTAPFTGVGRRISVAFDIVRQPRDHRVGAAGTGRT